MTRQPRKTIGTRSGLDEPFSGINFRAEVTLSHLQQICTAVAREPIANISNRAAELIELLDFQPAIE